MAVTKILKVTIIETDRESVSVSFIDKDKDKVTLTVTVRENAIENEAVPVTVRKTVTEKQQ